MTDSELSVYGDFRLLAFFPADYATVADGKLYVGGGGWDRLNFPSFPQVLPVAYLVALVEVPFAKYQADHVFRVGLEDPDGARLGYELSGEFRVGADPSIAYGDPTKMPIALPASGLQFDRPGNYSFTFGIDETEYGRFSVKASQMAVPVQFQFQPPGGPPRG